MRKIHTTTKLILSSLSLFSFFVLPMLLCAKAKAGTEEDAACTRAVESITDTNASLCGATEAAIAGAAADAAAPLLSGYASTGTLSGRAIGPGCAANVGPAVNSNTRANAISAQCTQIFATCETPCATTTITTDQAKCEAAGQLAISSNLQAGAALNTAVGAGGCTGAVADIALRDAGGAERALAGAGRVLDNAGGAIANNMMPLAIGAAVGAGAMMLLKKDDKKNAREEGIEEGRRLAEEEAKKKADEEEKTDGGTTNTASTNHTDPSVVNEIRRLIDMGCYEDASAMLRTNNDIDSETRNLAYQALEASRNGGGQSRQGCSSVASSGGGVSTQSTGSSGQGGFRTTPAPTPSAIGPVSNSAVANLDSRTPASAPPARACVIADLINTDQRIEVKECILALINSGAPNSLCSAWSHIEKLRTTPGWSGLANELSGTWRNKAGLDYETYAAVNTSCELVARY